MNNRTEYSIHINSPTDVAVALRCEADRASSEGFRHVAERQNALALHIENACHHLGKLAPEGYRLQLTIDFAFVADVNPVLRPEFRS